MHTEQEKMLAGELYDPLDPELVQARERARDLCQDLNATRERDQEARRLEKRMLPTRRTCRWCPGWWPENGKRHRRGRRCAPRRVC